MKKIIFFIKKTIQLPCLRSHMQPSLCSMTAMQGVHSQSYNSGWTGNTCSTALQQRRALPAPQHPDQVCCLSFLQSRCHGTHMRHELERKGTVQTKKILRKKSNRSGITPPEDSDLAEATGPIPSPSQGWKQQSAATSPGRAEGRRCCRGSQGEDSHLPRVHVGLGTVWVGPRSTQ